MLLVFFPVSLFTAAILASVFVNSGVALFNELSCETCYPVAEGIIGGYLTLLNNLTGILFLCVLYIPNIGEEDSLFFLSFCFLCFLLFRIIFVWK